MIEDLTKVPQGTVVLLHACAHNPTGVDPTKEQWQGILDLIKSRQLVIWFALDCSVSLLYILC